MEKNKASNHSDDSIKRARKKTASAKLKRNSSGLPTSRFNVEIPSDVLGSYTGIAENDYEQPVQDADDL